MNWPRIILDGLSLSLLFNAVAGLGLLDRRRSGDQSKIMMTEAETCF